jgi:hypothetical protein
MRNLYKIPTLVFLWCALWGLQGVDMSDEGWLLSAYQQAYRHPESVESVFLYYNAVAVGGLWNLIFGWMGMYGFRLLYALNTALLAATTCQILKPHVSRRIIYLGITLVLLAQNFGCIVFHHNQFTPLLLSISILLCLRKRYVLGGMVFGINYFTRLPNVTLSALLILFLIHAFRHKTLKPLGQTLAGILAGCISVLAYMAAAGHLHTFLNSVSSLGDAAQVSDSTHNLSYMLGIYLTDWLHVLLQMILPVWPLYDFVTYLYAISTLALIYTLYQHRHEEAKTLLPLAALIILYAQPLGSDFGIGNMGVFSLWLAVPLSCGIIWEKISAIKPKGIPGPLLPLLIFAIPLGYYTYTQTWGLLSCCMSDTGGRWNMTHRIHHPLATTFTTRANMLAADSLLAVLPRYVQPDDYLLCYQNTPMLHYYTHTRPYLYNPWLFTYDSGNFQKCIERAGRENPTPPVVIRDKGGYATWREYNPDWNNDHATDSYLHTNRKITLLNTFLRKHHYRIVWENATFQILVPPGKD